MTRSHVSLGPALKRDDLRCLEAKLYFQGNPHEDNLYGPIDMARVRKFSADGLYCVAYL